MSKYCLWKQLKKHLEKEGLDISKLSNIERYCNVIEDLDTCDTQKNVDVFEIHEVNQQSVFYDTIMKERLLVA